MSTFTVIILATVVIALIIALIVLISMLMKPEPEERIIDYNYDIQKIKRYMNLRYPNIDIDYNRITRKIKENNSAKSPLFLIAEDIVYQFARQQINITKRLEIPQKDLWTGYDVASIPIRNRIPKDFSRRKAALYMADQGCCRRCRTKLKIEEVMVSMIRTVENGGTYHLENLVLLCNDCYRITVVDDISKIVRSLMIYDEILDVIGA